MSRSNMAKSRTDKAGKSVSAPTPAQVHDIVPGKYNDQDWNLMLDHDDGDEFVTDIIEEICGSALDIIYKTYIDKQLIPYTVSQARDAIVQIIEWQFLTRDEGERNVSSDSGWLEDEEPAPAVTDCWAQGSVPKIATPREPTIVEVDEDQAQQEEQEMPEIKEEDESGDQEIEPPLGGVPHERTIIEEETLVIEGTSIPPPEFTEETETTVEPPKKAKFRPKYGPLKSAGVKKMTQSLEDTEREMYIQQYMQHLPPEKTADPDLLNMPNSCHSIVKLQAGRPPGRRDIFYDDYGKVLSVKKINPEDLPTHRVPVKYKILHGSETPRKQEADSIKTRFSIVDPEVEAAQERLEAMRTGRYIQKKPAKKEPKPPNMPKTATVGSRSRTHARTSQTSKTGLSSSWTTKSSKTEGRGLGPVSPLPPPLIESMDVAPGVIVREGDRVKKGPRQRPKEEELIAVTMQRGLRPVRLNDIAPHLTVAQILENRTPVVKPIVDQSPVPPIPAYQHV